MHKDLANIMMSSWLGSVKSTSQRLTIKESLFNQIAAVVFGGIRIRITLILMAVKTQKWKLFNILCWMTFCLTIFPKKLAEKSYSTINLRISLLLAGVSPFKTKYFGGDRSRRHHGHSCQRQKIRMLSNFFQQVFPGKW